MVGLSRDEVDRLTLPELDDLAEGDQRRWNRQAALVAWAVAQIHYLVWVGARHAMAEAFSKEQPPPMQPADWREVVKYVPGYRAEE